MIQVDNLAIGFPSETGSVQPVVRGVSLRVEPSERVGLVGESGSGKSLLALACLGLVPEPGQVLGGSVTLDGIDLATASAVDFQRIRGSRIGLVFQEAVASLNPVYTVGMQLAEVVKKLPLDKLLTETDCPFLPPQGKRGQRNEPSYVTTIVAEIARIKVISVAEVDRTTSSNAMRLFKLA